MAEPTTFDTGPAGDLSIEDEGRVEDTELQEFTDTLADLVGPIKGFETDMVVSFKNGSGENRGRLKELVATYQENVGAFFGKLFGDPSFADIKMVLTSRDVWKKVMDSLSAEDIGFILTKSVEDPKLRALLPEQVASMLDAGVEPAAENLNKLINTVTNPDNPDGLVLLQRAFNEGVDPLAVIGGYYGEELQAAYPDTASTLISETRQAHHQGAMGIGLEASNLLAEGRSVEDMTPQERAAVMWTTTALITELYGDETTSSPEEKWNSQVKPVLDMMSHLIGGQPDTDTDTRLLELARESGLSFEQIKTATAEALQSGSTGLDSSALFELAVSAQRAKPGEVVDEAGSPMEGLFYADTPEYPYLTMAFAGEQIGIQKVTEDATRMSEHGEVSMSLPPSITSELQARFPFMDKNQKITLRPDGADYEVPISGPGASYVYINDGTFFNDPERVYRYTVGEQEQEVRPSEILDFLREKRTELEAAS